MSTAQTLNVDSIAAFLGSEVGSSARLAPTERNVQGIVGAWAAVSKIANACALMMVEADVIAADKRTLVDPRPPVVEAPCSEYPSSFEFWKELFSHGLCRGNWVGVRYDFDAAGYARQVMPVPMDAVNARYDDAGYPVYDIAGAEYSRDELVHVRFGLTLPGQILAIGAVEAHRRGLQGMLDLQRMASGIWSEAGVPTGLVKLNIDQPTTAQAETVKTNWISVHGGKRTVGVIGKNMDYSPVTWSAQDAQFLESRQFSIAECALMFGLRPEDLGSTFGASSGAMSYGNRTDDALQRIIDAYTPVMVPVEQHWTALTPGRQRVRGDAEALLRASPKERMEVHKLAQEVGVETKNESRELEGKEPLPELDRPSPPAPPAPAPIPTIDPTGDLNQ